MTQRRLFVPLAALTLAVLTCGAAFAQPGPPPGPGAGPGPQMGPPPAQGPQLTDEQIIKLQALAKEQRDRLRPASDQARKLREDLHAEFWADKPDEAKTKQLRADLTKVEQEILAARLDFQARRAQAFTPEQRKQMRSLRARQWFMGAGEFPGRGPRGGRQGMGPAGQGQPMGPAGRGQRMLRGPMGRGFGPYRPWREEAK